MLRLFVYGTLKRGFWNHDRFCRGVLDVREAVVRGRLYEMHSGIPVLQVPDGDVLAHGSPDPLADVAAQAQFSEQPASYSEPILKSATAGDWGPSVRGTSHLRRPQDTPARHRPPGGFPSGRPQPLQTGPCVGM
ncbi:gamma-glutamylcyclotransferase family protein [Desulfoglaeba alkanexedens]|uniref:gamma-glutamylcyclotransferase family protein n=1 Tax=Desulfoglaeba alkanexedens TaxID=361111 RepID=UPI001B876F7F|nr:gamma-glutamylcyclotransferase [Desulfoglaeba alkanexedens]